MQNRQTFHSTSLKTALLCLAAFLSITAWGQKVLPAGVVLETIDKGEPALFENLIIRGTLDFSQLETNRKGGSYGAWRGVVKEFVHQVLSPVKFVNCTFEGEIVTLSENRVPGVLKENFTWFEAPVTFEGCRFIERVEFLRMKMKKQLSMIDCIFEDDIRFDRVHFDVKPVFSGNTIDGNFTNKRTNWIVQNDEIQKPAPRPANAVLVKLKNPSWKKIQIKFGSNSWSLSPLGTSGLNTVVGEKIYVLEKGQKKRLVLTVDKNMDGQTIDISKL